MPQNLKPPSKSYPDDGRTVGSDAIFSSPNVVPPQTIRPQEVIPLPPKEDGIPAPSIYYDDRGEIHNIKVDNKHRINILYTKTGHLRSGDLHPNEQCDFIFSGKVKVWTLAEDGSTNTATYGKHEFISIARGTPHVFEFVEDTVMAEWWEPQGFQAWFYKPYRDIVNKSMLERDDCEDKRKPKGLVVLSPCNDWSSARMFGAAIIGMMGFALGSRFGIRNAG
mmetsp:Transcript_10733/g.23787  ORF Transcript_10733/g.23787 Transcript_10733/m.23787 type:complete len:222 (+) Transcript_10733:162-827(+)|eukprot:CAMPEP_0172312460 /NCGR_PEP_ID=MMETSP1058-20130122/17569_1 /TAXON_ID=83371 /ORGANISM="Detonula confervacea, Strain CCMP 353" /LENGTH=221 /DNA_ID=CAMNT_0013025925 /DNA_START=77 /DNA_END=742 /DNA_ORIENTATION=-